MLKFEIKGRWAGNVVFEAEIAADEDTPLSVRLGLAVMVAYKQGADLRGADLSGADLRGADLSGADLSGADLSGADLRGACLSGADLSGADLRGACLSGADLSGADLSGADLSGADLRGACLSGAYLRGAYLRGAYLSGAYLRGAYLRGADLSGANLEDIKNDFFERLALARNEIVGLYDYLIRGRINGLVYEGTCACFCGTVANIAKQNYKELSSGLRPDGDSPTERWFMAILQGDTPENNEVSAITAEWMREFMARETIRYPQYKLVSSDEFPGAFAFAA